MFALLRALSLPEWRHQRGHTLVIVLSIALGVALSFAVHLINESALSEFSSAVRRVNSQADFELRAQREGFDEVWYGRVAAHPQVAAVSPVIELDVIAVYSALDASSAASAAAPKHLNLKLLGVDALVLPSLSPDLFPQPRAGAERLAMIHPDAIFLNGAAVAIGGGALPQSLQLRVGDTLQTIPVQGRIAANGSPLAVMDLAGVQARFGWLGRLSRLDVRLVPGAQQATVLRELRESGLPASLRAVTPDQAAQQVSNVSRAYRVNLTVLALVALFTGGFLVFSALSLSVARRLPNLALLGVLGLSARERFQLVLLEALVLGSIGSLLGLMLGTGLAYSALQWLAGDLGGGYFPGVVPSLHWTWASAGLFGGLGLLACGVGAWLPARMAQGIAPAQALKGVQLGLAADSRSRWARAAGPLLLGLGALLALAPPVGGLPLPAYAAVACGLLGGMACVPPLVALLLAGVRPTQRALPLLAVERARQQRHVATVAVSGVVASLALSVALTIMVDSFRQSMMQWLDTVLPADIYVRSAGGGSGGRAGGTSSNAAETHFLSPAWIAQAARVPGVARLETVRTVPIQLRADRPSVALISRSVGDPRRSLPLVGELAPGWQRTPPNPEALNQPGVPVPVYVSEALLSLYAAQLGETFTLPLPDGRDVLTQVVGVWRDYARQSGAIVMDRPDFERLTGDTRVNDVALWVQAGADVDGVQSALRGLSADPDTRDPPSLLEFASAAEIRALSLRIFDRSFAVTYWLQSVAIAMGLFGLATSVSAQVLARRKEFGLLSHLGLSRAQILLLVASESAVWTGCGALLGLLLGVAISAVLVFVVNPQSFHWTMDLLIPWWRLVGLCGAVVLAGTVVATMAGRSATHGQAALAVKEDW